MIDSLLVEILRRHALRELPLPESQRVLEREPHPLKEQPVPMRKKRDSPAVQEYTQPFALLWDCHKDRTTDWRVVYAITIQGQCRETMGRRSS